MYCFAVLQWHNCLKIFQARSGVFFCLFFFSYLKVEQRKLIIISIPLTYTDPVLRVKVADTATGNKVCEVADAPGSSNYDVRKYFGFQVSGNEKAKKGDGERKKYIYIIQSLPDYNLYTPEGLLCYSLYSILTFRV